MAESGCGGGERTHYHYSIGLRLWHPSADPDRFSSTLGLQPRHTQMAGQTRTTPKGHVLPGISATSFWYASLLAGRWPKELGEAIDDVLRGLAPHRALLHEIRSEGGRVELSIGWFFENQSGGVLGHAVLALAGDLQIDLSFDVYPPDQKQQA